jgi:nucleotide-binding universal stress UspA family protein
MRALVWVTENTWEPCVDRARELLPDRADLTLLHVTPSDVEHLVTAGPARLLGRHPRSPPGDPSTAAVSDEEAGALLDAALTRLGRPARTIARRGHIEHTVIEECTEADLLVVARDGEPRVGPASLGHRTRFVVDHAPCQVLLVWTGARHRNLNPGGGAR